MSGGVGGLTGAISSARPDRRSVTLSAQPDPKLAQSVGIGGIRQERHCPPSAGVQPEVKDDDLGMGVAAGQMPPLHPAIAGVQPPAPIQPFNPANEAAPACMTVTPSKPGQRQAYANHRASLDPPRNAGQDHGNASQQMTEAAADQQAPRRTQFNDQRR